MAIEAGTPSGVKQVTLADGSRFFVFEQLLKQQGLLDQQYAATIRRSPTDGSVRLREELANLQLRTQQTLARRKATELLARREYSREELVQRLAQRGYERGVVLPVLDELAERGYQSDRRYALAWIASRVRRRPQARGLLLLELKAKGVAVPTAEAALNEYEQDNPDWEERALEEAAGRALRGKRVTRDGVASRLTQLGFRVAAARRAAERFVSESESDEER